MYEFQAGNNPIAEIKSEVIVKDLWINCNKLIGTFIFTCWGEEKEVQIGW